MFHARRLVSPPAGAPGGTREGIFWNPPPRSKAKNESALRGPVYRDWHDELFDYLRGLIPSPKTEEEPEKPLVLSDVFSYEQEDPSVKAARKVDWEMFTATLNERFRAIIDVLAEGRCLKEIVQMPQRRNNLLAHREFLACGEERQPC